MKITTKFDDPKTVQVSVTVVATVEQWARIAAVLAQSSDGAASNMCATITRQIGNVSRYAETEHVE